MDLNSSLLNTAESCITLNCQHTYCFLCLVALPDLLGSMNFA